MEMIGELAEQFESQQSMANGSCLIRIGSEVLRLNGLSAGVDFLLGYRDGDLVAIPRSAVIELTGSLPTAHSATSLAEFLASLRLPVRLSCLVGAEIRRSWLLNVSANWLRVSSQAGISWLPLEALLIAEVTDASSLSETNGNS